MQCQRSTDVPALRAETVPALGWSGHFGLSTCQHPLRGTTFEDEEHLAASLALLRLTCADNDVRLRRDRSIEQGTCNVSSRALEEGLWTLPGTDDVQKRVAAWADLRPSTFLVCAHSVEVELRPAHPTRSVCHSCHPLSEVSRGRVAFASPQGVGLVSVSGCQVPTPNRLVPYSYALGSSGSPSGPLGPNSSSAFMPKPRWS